MKQRRQHSPEVFKQIIELAEDCGGVGASVQKLVDAERGAAKPCEIRLNSGLQNAEINQLF